jgi:peroxiredoxin
MLAPGDKVPEFTLPIAYADGRKDRVSFLSLLGKGPIVLSFFPLSFTRVCTTQMCDMRDHGVALDQVRAQRFGFSCDSSFVNVHFARQEKLDHGIVSDPNREVVDRIWATEEVAGVKRVPKRGWMVVDDRGVVVDLWLAKEAGAPWPGMGPIEAALAKIS